MALGYGLPPCINNNNVGPQSSRLGKAHHHTYLGSLQAQSLLCLFRKVNAYIVAHCTDTRSRVHLSSGQVLRDVARLPLVPPKVM